MDRIAQIQLDINDVTSDILTQATPAVPSLCTETPRRNEDQWQDLISKFKSLILSAFDMRVNQYEEDIREKDAQRSLPGWNFCTFFLLKEGLARGYESVGLIGDSLVEYDELAIGLDAIVREQVLGNRPEHGGSFLPFTDELKQQIDTAMANISEGLEKSDNINLMTQIDMKTDFSSYDECEIPLNATKKRYRELILANNISIFDFRCYLISRQLHLLLRLAKTSPSHEELSSQQEQLEQNPKSSKSSNPISQTWDEDRNLIVLSRICSRAREFISGIPCIMYTDILAAYNHQNRSSSKNEVNNMDTNNLLMHVSDNIIQSFIFSTTLQILAHTHVKSLSVFCSKKMPHCPDKQESNSVISELKSTKHLVRSSSLATRSHQGKRIDQGSFPRSRRASVPNHGSKNTLLTKMGLEELAANRAELFHFARSVLQRAGARRGWSVGWIELAKLQVQLTEELEDIDLRQDSNERPICSPELNILLPSDGISSNLLRNALSSEHNFYQLYESLSYKIFWHYTVANCQNSVQSSMADLAVLKYHLKDYLSASFYLNRIIPFFDESGWSNIELQMLTLHANCLQQLKRKDEYVQVIIKLLTKTAIAENERLNQKSGTFREKNMISDYCALVTDGHLSELFKITRSLDKITNIPLQSIFGRVEVDETVKYHQNMDSFELQIKLLYLLDVVLEIEIAKVTIYSDTNDSTHHIHLEAMDTLIIKKGINQISVQSKVRKP